MNKERKARIISFRMAKLKQMPPKIPPPPEFTSEQLEQQLNEVLEEYKDCYSVAKHEIIGASKSDNSKLVLDSYSSSFERSEMGRIRTGELFVKLIKLGTISVDKFCRGLEEVLLTVNEKIIDVPQFWEYIAETTAPLIYEGVITFGILFECWKGKEPQPQFITTLFKVISEEKGPKFLYSLWQLSKEWLNFKPETELRKYITISNKTNEFLLEPDCSLPLSECSLTYNEIKKKLLSFFLQNMSSDEVMKWIEANIGDKKELYFIRALMTAVIMHSVVNQKLKADVFKSHYDVLNQVILDRESEIHCLYSIQAFINKMGYPEDLLLSVFRMLCENKVISNGSFITWKEEQNFDSLHIFEI